MFGKKLLFTLGMATLLATGAAEAAPVTLKFATQNAENAWSTENGLIPWLRKIEAESDGTLKIELYANQTLAKGPQVWAAIRNGIADMGWIPMNMYAGMNQLMEVVGLGGLAAEDALQGTERVWNVYENVEAVRKPWAANRMLAVYSTDTASIFLMTKKPVRTLEDLKGMKIRCTAGAYVNWLTALGATPVVMAAPDVYMSLQKGVIDGLIGDWELVAGFRFADVAPYITKNIPIGNVNFAVAMNRRTYDSLPAEAKKAIDDNSGRAGSMWLARHFSLDSRELEKEVAPALKELITLSAEEKARWTELVGRPLWDKWLETMDDKGLKDAPVVLDYMTK